MRTGTDINRRRWLQGIGALALMPVSHWARATAPSWLAAWDRDGRHHVGVLAVAGDVVRVQAALEVPTRAHGLVFEPEGTALAVARRPGHWLLRFDPQRGRVLRWHWLDSGDTQLNGHALRSADGATLYTSETDPDSGEGRIGVRDAGTLALREAWASGGRDPHQLLLNADGTLWVANGGIDTRPETGRRKLDLERMDSSLVRLDARTGRLLGQWRLADRRLSLRHLAWGPRGSLGIALQAEHDDASERTRAPVLAVWDERLGLCTAAAAPSGEPGDGQLGGDLGGYGGDIAAWDQGFVVSCPRRDTLARWRLESDGRLAWHGATRLPGACALSGAADGSRPHSQPTGSLSVAGRAAVLQADAGISTTLLPGGMLIDNHWQRIAAG